MNGGPARLAARRLFEPYAELLAALPTDGALSPGVLDALAAGLKSPPCLADGRRIRFVAPAGAEAAYEAHISEHAEVPTRPGSWHDAFNALVWCAFPRSKAAINHRHLAAIAAAPAGRRGRVRDALTLFDECGVLVSCTEPSLINDLRAHRWEEVLWARRTDLASCMNFMVFGHAALDALRAPFVGLCGKALYREVGPEWFALAPHEACAEADRWLAAWLLDASPALAPRDFSPLPLLGIPGVTADSETADYYRDPRQFRPPRPAATAAGV